MRGDSGEYCIIWLGPEFAGDQRLDDATSPTFDSEVLTQPIDVVGAPTLTLHFSSDRPVAKGAVRLNTVWPDGAVSRLSYAVLNLCHRDGHAHPQALDVGKTYTVRIELDDVATRIPKGNKLGVALSTSYWPMTWPAPEPVTLTIHRAASSMCRCAPDAAMKSRLPLPPSEAAKPVTLVELRKPFNQRELTRDLATGEIRLSIVDDFGRSTIAERGLALWACGRARYSILPDDPLSARQECHWSEERARSDWKVRTETWSATTASKTHWYVTGRLEAYEYDTLLCGRDWDQKIRRKLL